MTHCSCEVDEKIGTVRSTQQRRRAGVRTRHADTAGTMKVSGRMSSYSSLTGADVKGLRQCVFLQRKSLRERDYRWVFEHGADRHFDSKAGANPIAEPDDEK